MGCSTFLDRGAPVFAQGDKRMEHLLFMSAAESWDWSFSLDTKAKDNGEWTKGNREPYGSICGGQQYLAVL